MKFKYKSIFSSDDSDERVSGLPLVPIRLKNGRNEISIDCLLDSGASETLLSQDIADLLDIDLSDAEEQSYIGISDESVSGRRRKILIKVQGFDEWIMINAGFIPINEMPLLGHAGFFEHYEITFRAYQQRFEIKKPKNK